MKKMFFALLCVLVIIIAGFISYSGKYTITNDKKQLGRNILEFINRQKLISNEIDIKEELTLDNKKFVLFIISDGFGHAELTKGFNNKYKIESATYGNSFFRNEINKTNEGRYIILTGKSHNLKIAYVKVLLDNKEYKISIPEQEYYMAYCKVPIETEWAFLEFDNVKFYNKDNVDITDDIF